MLKPYLYAPGRCLRKEYVHVCIYIHILYFYSKVHKIDLIVAKLDAIGHPLSDVKHDSHYISKGKHLFI